jgi:hypothetical protein
MTLLPRCVAVILLALLVTACTGPPGTSPPPPPVIASVAPTAPLNAVATPSDAPLVSKACDDAFAAAAAIDDMHDTVTDLDPAVAACTTLAEWTAASVAHPGAISEGVDPAEFLRNRCDESYLASTALCQSVTPSVAPDTAAIVAKLCAPPAYSECASGRRALRRRDGRRHHAGRLRLRERYGRRRRDRLGQRGRRRGDVLGRRADLPEQGRADRSAALTAVCDVGARVR